MALPVGFIINNKNIKLGPCQCYVSCTIPSSPCFVQEKLIENFILFYDKRKRVTPMFNYGGCLANH